RDWSTQIRAGLAMLFFIIGCLGAYRHFKADLRTAVAMTTLMATFTLVLIFYLNFKYGYSWAPDNAQLQREVRERDYFFIASFALWGVWVGMGLATLMEWVNEALEDREHGLVSPAAAAPAARDLRLLDCAGDLSGSRVAQAGWQAARLFRFVHPGLAPAGVLAGREAGGEPGRCDGRARPAAAGPPVSR